MRMVRTRTMPGRLHVRASFCVVLRAALQRERAVQSIAEVAAGLLQAKRHGSEAQRGAMITAGCSSSRPELS